MNFHAKVRLNADDIADAQLAMPQVRRMWWTLSCFAAFLVFLLSNGLGGSIRVTGPLVLTAGVGLYLLRGRLQRLTAAKNLVGMADDELQLDYEFTDTGYSASSARRMGGGTWESLHGWLESPKAIALKPTHLVMEVIPKSGLGAANTAELLALLRTRVPQRQVQQSFFGRFRLILLWTVLIILFFTFYSIFSRQRPTPRRGSPPAEAEP